MSDLIEHLKQAQALAGDAQRAFTKGEILEAKGAMLLLTNEINHALCVLGAMGPAGPMAQSWEKDPFNVKPKE